MHAAGDRPHGQPVGEIRARFHESRGERAHEPRAVRRAAVYPAGVPRPFGECLRRALKRAASLLGQAQFALPGVEIGPVVRAGVADIAPVALHRHAADAAPGRHQPREKIAGKIKGRIRRDEAQYLRGQNIDAGVYQIGHDALPCGLFDEAAHPPLAVGHGETVGQRRFVRVERHRNGGVRAPMLVPEGAKIKIARGVAADDERVFPRDKILAVFHRARGAERSVLAPVLHAHAEAAAIAEVPLDLLGQAGRRAAEIPEAAALQKRYDVLEHRRAEQLRHGLRHRAVSDRGEPRPSLLPPK